MACFRDFVSDFDLMLQRKKDEMKKRRRRRRDVDIINDNDDLIEDIIRRMMEAAEVCMYTTCTELPRSQSHIGSASNSALKVLVMYSVS